MVEFHSKSFFGQNTGLILSSSSKFQPFIFLRCIKKKPDGTWEKPSENEGKLIKCSLEELVMILEVLSHRSLNWQSFHNYKDKKTSLSFNWEEKNADTLWINIGDYSKMLNLAQAEVLRLLLLHILKEKIVFATGLNGKEKNEKRKYNFHDEQAYSNFIEEIYENDIQHQKKIPKKSSRNTIVKTMSNIDGKISNETVKAILIKFGSGKEVWIPKSSIHCQYSPRKNLSQKFLIDNWILKRKEIIS
ncbi:MAG: hypothetical protein ACFE85_05450 [Candidatus Hodarchaeota archaeon]